MKNQIKLFSIEYHRNGSLNSFYSVGFWLKQPKYKHQKNEPYFVVGTFETYDTDTTVNNINTDSARFMSPDHLGDKLDGGFLITLLKEKLKENDLFGLTRYIPINKTA